MEMRIWRDDWGGIRVETPYPLLGQFLTSDIQWSRNSCLELLEWVGDVRANRADLYEGSGNSQHITIEAEGVLIEALYEDAENPVPLDDFEFAVREWLTYLQTHYNEQGERREPSP